MAIAEYYWGSIQIGGSVPKRLVPAVIDQLILALGVNIRDLDRLSIFSRVEVGTGFEEGVVFFATDEEARDGHFAKLEDWLREHDIAYDTWESTDGQYDRVSRRFRPGMRKEAIFVTNADGREVFTWDEVKKAVEGANGAALSAGGMMPDRVTGVVHTTKNALGLNFKALEPLRFVE